MIFIKNISIVYLGLFLFAASSAVAQMHTFTNSSGSTLEAKLVSHKDGKITLQRADGKEFEVKPEIFSTADQKFIAQWIAVTPAHVNYRFRIDGDKKRLGGNQWAYVISIINQSQDEVTNLNFNYRVLYNSYDGKASANRNEGSEHLEAKLKFNRTLEITTKGVEIYNEEWAKGQIFGCLLQVTDSTGKVIEEWTSSELYMKGKTWENTTERCEENNGGSAVIK